MDGRDMRALREEADVTRRELAERVPFSHQMIQRIEDGSKAVPAEYPAELSRALSALRAERQVRMDTAAAKAAAMIEAAEADREPVTA